MLKPLSNNSKIFVEQQWHWLDNAWWYQLSADFKEDICDGTEIVETLDYILRPIARKPMVWPTLLRKYLFK